MASISVKLLSGKTQTLDVPLEMTIRELKEKVRAACPQCQQDEVLQRLSRVDIVVGDEILTDDAKISAHSAKVRALFKMPKAIQCESRDASGYEVEELHDVLIPDSVTRIKAFAFQGCHNLLRVTIPPSVTSIGLGAFDGCSSLIRVIIPSSVTAIGHCAFGSCSSLTSVACQGNRTVVMKIGHYAFGGCRSLTSLTLPDLSDLADDAFDGCSSLTAGSTGRSSKRQRTDEPKFLRVV